MHGIYAQSEYLQGHGSEQWHGVVVAKYDGADNRPTVDFNPCLSESPPYMSVIRYDEIPEFYRFDPEFSQKRTRQHRVGCAGVHKRIDFLIACPLRVSDFQLDLKYSH